ncbi:MAG: glycosyl hydrolase family 2, partial [Terriglobales bacterium]
AWGFNTEVGPGAVPPPLESLEAMLPQDHRWPIEEIWDFHCGGGEFKKMTDFTRALDARFGKSTGIADFAWKSQAQAYETIRAMYEGFRANKFEATGEIQWMLNNAWPSMIWHLYDWYLTPTGGFFAARKANEPLHIQYSYDDASVVVVNNEYKPFHSLKATATVYNLDMTRKYTNTQQVDVTDDGVTRAFNIPAVEGLTPTYFLKLELHDPAGKLVSSNFYWLSTQADVIDWAKTISYVTPETQYADLKGLNDLPKVKLTASATLHEAAGAKITTVTLRNHSNALAFLVRVRLLDPAGKDVLPVLWDDNFVSLLPGETREIIAHVEPHQLTGNPTVRIEGWNVSEESVAVK